MTASKPASVDPSTPSERALAVVADAGAGYEAVLKTWTDAKNAEAVQEVALRGKGAARKAARHYLNVLKARGVPLPDERRVAKLAPVPSEVEAAAHMLAPDSMFNVLLVVEHRKKASRSEACFVLLNDAQGVHRVDTGEFSHSGLREAMAKALPGVDYKAVSVPVEWARGRIRDALALHRERKVPEPMGLMRARSLLEPVPVTTPEHPFDAEGLALALEDAREAAKSSAILHALPEFRTWLPQRSAVDELLANVGKTLSPDQQPAPDALQRTLADEILAATDRYFTPERRAALARALKDSAYSVLQRDGEAKALEIVAARVAIEHAGLITDPPREIPFLKGFFDKAVALLLAQSGGRLRVPVPRRTGEVPVDVGAGGETALLESAAPAAADAGDAGA